MKKNLSVSNRRLGTCPHLKPSLTHLAGDERGQHPLVAKQRTLAVEQAHEERRATLRRATTLGRCELNVDRRAPSAVEAIAKAGGDAKVLCSNGKEATWIIGSI